jgi:hypothetical protein
MEEVINRLKKMKGMGYIDDSESGFLWSKLQRTSIHYWNIPDEFFHFKTRETRYYTDKELRELVEKSLEGFDEYLEKLFQEADDRSSK